MKTIIIDKKLFSILVTFQVALILAAFTGGMLADRWIESRRNQYPLMRQAYSIIQNHALFELPSDTQMEYGMIRGMISALKDPYAGFYEPPQHELQSNLLEGQYGGIGVRVEPGSDGGFMLYPYPDSPASAAGIQDGDALVAVDQWEVEPDASMDAVEAALRGPVDERVRVVVSRAPDGGRLSFLIQRAVIPLPSVTWNLTEQDQRAGLVKVNVIAGTSAAEIEAAITDLLSRGAQGVILDLRGNGGGLVEGGVDIARLFLSAGTVIEQQYRDQPVRTHRVERAGPLSDLPLVVLVDQGTASAAEIVAGALQAQGRALLVGSPTHGKDTIQLVFDLQDQSSLHVTAARWWVPGNQDQPAGRQLQPDILLPGDADHQPAVLDAAVKALVQ